MGTFLKILFMSYFIPQKIRGILIKQPLYLKSITIHIELCICFI